MAYLGRLRRLDLPERAIELERDAWILVAAELPEQMPMLMALKQAQIDTPAVTAMYRDLVEVADWQTDDPRLPAFADRLVSLIEQPTGDGQEGADDPVGFHALGDDLVELLDSVFLNAVPVAPRLLELLRERGWTGWSRLERIVPRRPGATPTAVAAAALPVDLVPPA